jgi:hypothetical protein
MERRTGLLTPVIASVLTGCASVVGGGADAPQVAEIVCQDGTRVETPVVEVQPDGVHLRVDNRTGAERYIYREVEEGARNEHQAPPGVSESVSLEGPGLWRVTCSPPPIYPSEGSSWAELQVLDPGDLWVSDRLDCDDIEGTHPDYFGDLPAGWTGDLLELAQREVPEEMLDPRPGDVVEPAGYPKARIRSFRAVREGEIVAVASYVDSDRGGWVFSGIEYCLEEDDGHSEPSY